MSVGGKGGREPVRSYLDPPLSKVDKLPQDATKLTKKIRKFQG